MFLHSRFYKYFSFHLTLKNCIQNSVTYLRWGALFGTLKIAGKNDNVGTKIVIIIVLLSYLNHFWRTLEMPLPNCEINLILSWYPNCFATDDLVVTQVPKFTLTDTKLYVLVVTLSTQDNEH